MAALGYRRRVTHPPTPHPNAQRWSLLDQVRGLAVLWMTAYHLAFDLNHFGWIRQDFLVDPVWTVQRTLIVSLFLGCAGFAQALALQQGLGWTRFWRRWAQVAGCALLVTAGSWWMFPRSFIYFGVLHAVAVMLPLMRLVGAGSPSPGRLWALALLGALAVAAPWLAAWTHAQLPSLAFLNSPAWNWIGWIGRKPITEDYLPLLPWIGVMLWGLALGHAWTRRTSNAKALSQPSNASRPSSALGWIGRHSLSWYILHQPVLIGLLMLLGRPGI